MGLIKTLGVAMMAVLTLTAVAASSASAAQFQAEEYPVTLKGAQSTQHVFTIEGGLTVSCKTVVFEGQEKYGEKQQSITMTPTYEGCKAFGFVEAAVNMEGCQYEYPEPQGTSSPYSGQVSVQCPEGQLITITAGTCEVRVGEQGPLQTVKYTNNEGPPKTITVGAGVEQIAYNKIEDGLLCPLNGTGENGDGKYTGNALVKGFNQNSEQVGIFVE